MLFLILLDDGTFFQILHLSGRCQENITPKLRLNFIALIVFTLLYGCNIAENQSTLVKTGLPEEIFNSEWQLIQNFDDSEHFTDQSNSMLIFGWEENRIFGSAGCNRFSGAYLPGDNSKLSFENLISTKIGCTNANFESQFFNSLNRVSYFSFNEDFSVLSLLDSDGETLFTFKKTALKRV